MDPEIGRRLDKQDDKLDEQRDVMAKNSDTLSRIDENLRLFREDITGGDGKVGRIKVLEDRVDDLEEHKNRAVGFTVAIGVLWSMVLGVIEWLHIKK